MSKDLNDLMRPDKRSRRELQQAGEEADRWVENAFTIGGALIGGLGGLVRAAGGRVGMNHRDFVGLPLVITLVGALVGAWLGRRLARARAK